MKRAVLILAVLELTAPAARADYITTVTFDTSVLQSNLGQGPFAVLIELSDGSNGEGVNNNTATISNFDLHGGSLTPVSPPFGLSGSGSGDLGSSLKLPRNSHQQSVSFQWVKGQSERYGRAPSPFLTAALRPRLGRLVFRL